MTPGSPTPSPDDPAARRPFLVSFAAIVSGAIVTLFPFFTGAGVLFDPLRRRVTAVPDDESSDIASNTAPAAKFIRICPLDSVDGVPRPFPVITDVVNDAWTRTFNQRVGLVFISRTASADGSSKLTAFNATCPHLGCAVEFNTGDSQFECPCHASAFAKDGEKLFGPSLRGLDRLDAKVETNGEHKEIWVAFQKFHTGIAERKPVG